jgi:Domain of unknown function (DUF3291)
MTEFHIAQLNWQPAGTLPPVEEALARLDRLTTLGPTPEAFTFKERFPPPLEAVTRTMTGTAEVPSA